ncbi:S41 family peptidase [Pseudoteredinibacter isoporae]|uniref:C-terminal processing protease CtpA/Prc n=1 Tax=Pseudoteredinibacter isoporae TaxID=570281 RepID=A0A7X0JU94_9GAMM|nr:S41 family peptidase [Pseudoteredinibacter isoporae]MBB6521501.1 C-terminal processing protease CtpA/Prc [Pseudoteredinibacter isoporae]NHO87055.1 hypothetical protein [Pseudoteredinibacter isoporae]NIB22802.1 hypothetical protein [Pseudoteredinibacter isoporae]
MLDPGQATRRSTLEARVLEIEALVKTILIDGEKLNALDYTNLIAANAWVIDLRDHSGGKLYAFLDMIYPLLPHGRLSGVRDNQGLELFNWVTPEGIGIGSKDHVQKLRAVQGAAISSSIPINTPVAVLLNKNTARTGEFLTLLLKERPNTQIIGEPSNGLLSANAPQTLSNGDILVLPTARAIDN